MATINDRVSYVQSMLGERTDLATKIVTWLKDAYIELSMMYPFEELQDTQTTTIDLTTGEFIAYPTPASTGGVRGVVIIELWDTLGTTFKWVLKRKSVRNLANYPPTPTGPPTVYAPFGVTKNVDGTIKNYNIQVRSVPDAAYKLKWRLWMKPTIAGTVSSTVILLPDDWLEILDYAAAMRGFAVLNTQDKAMGIMQLLHGTNDPKTGRVIPGLIAQRIRKQQAESIDEDYALDPLITPYSAGR